MQGNNSSINERYKQTLPKIKLQDLKRDVESRFDVVLTSHIHFVKNSYDDRNPNYIFDKCWEFLLKDNISKYLFTYFNNPLQLNYKEFVLLFLLKKLKQTGINYSPKINITEQKSSSCFKELKGAALILSVHNGFAFTARIISDLGLNVTTISSDPFISATFNRSGILNPINIIKNDIYCLAQLSKSIFNGDIVCCNIDYAGPDGVYNYISPVLFEFADRFKIPLYFARFGLPTLL